MSHVIRVVLTCVSKIKSDGCDFCNHTMHQSLLGGPGVFQADPGVSIYYLSCLWVGFSHQGSVTPALGIVPPNSMCEFPPTRSYVYEVTPDCKCEETHYQ